MYKTKTINLFLGVLILFFMMCVQADESADPPYMKSDLMAEDWADSLMATLTPEEKIAQLFMISAYSNQDEAHYRLTEKYIREYKIGGLIMMQGTPDKQVELINRYQKASEVPLLIGFDGEWGLSMRLKNVIDYPRQMVLGAVKNDLLIYEMGREFARQMKLTGIHVNFAPVIDVNNNPKNPVINDRAFGEDTDNVIRKGVMYMKGLQDGGVMACAKHFPGHGDTDVDSHYDLPVIKHSKERLDSIELKPFKALSENGVASMMVSHLSMPAIDNTPNLPATLSPKVINGILRDEIGYEGLVFTDAMNMKGITKYFPSGEAEVRALLAGNDIMLFPDNVPKAINGVMDAMRSGRLPQDLIDQKVRKVLLAKYWAGLHESPVLATRQLDEKINTDYAAYLKDKLLLEAITLVSDNHHLVPIADLSEKKIAAVHISGSDKNIFSSTLDKYAPVDHFYISKNASHAEFQSLLHQLRAYNLVINAHFGMLRSSSRKHGLTANSIDFTKKLNESKEVINVFFGIPYVLNYLPEFPTVMIAYTAEDASQSGAAQAVFGGIDITGQLPVRAGKFAVNTGEVRSGGVRLKYMSPYYFGLEPSSFDAIDKILDKIVKDGATPGGQVLVAYKGAVIYEKSFGYHTYDKKVKVEDTDLYDIASITKVAATAPVLMTMGETGTFSINKRLYQYLPDLKGNKRNLLLQDILTHQSGLTAWIPFYKETLAENKQPKSHLFNKYYSEKYSVKVAENMYMDHAYIDTLYAMIENDPLKDKRYRYSDLGYYYFKKIIESHYKHSMDVVVDSLIWRRLGGNYTMYNPLEKGVPLSAIAPTEEDNYFRMQKVHGHVHDQGAAMLNGVAGHAGLFSNANDLAKYFQMLLNKGYYGNERFFKPETVDAFTSQVHSNNRRALAFDKKVTDHNTGGPACTCVSESSFGHTGFTGTIAWADPEREIVFIFLSNRTYPDAENRLLIRQNIRTDIQNIIYDIIEE